MTLQEHLTRMEIADLKQELVISIVWHFRMTVELFKLMKQFTACTNADIDPELLAKAQAWIAKLDRLKEIDE